MGRWGWRVPQNEPRERLRVSRSGSYSDDYRITPELTRTSDSYNNGHNAPHRRPSRGPHGPGEGGGGGGCSQDEGCCCSEVGDPCCSQDERYYPSSAPQRAYSPRGKGRSVSAEALRPRRGSMGGLGVVVVDEERLDHRRQQAPCTSCESCDTCGDWPADSFTRIELRNNLFTSPMQTQEFYDSPNYAYKGQDSSSPVRGRDSSSPVRGRQSSSPVRGRESSSPARGRSPQRRFSAPDGPSRRTGPNPGISNRPSTVEEIGLRARPRSRLPRSQSNAQRASVSPNRMTRASNGSRAPSTRRSAPTGRNESRGRQSYRSSQHSKNGPDASGSRIPSTGGSQSEMLDHAQDNSNLRKSKSPGRKIYPTADVAPAGGRSPGSGGGGGGPGPGGGPGGGGGGVVEGVGGGQPHPKQDSSGKVSMTLTKRDLLNQMVSQTKQHRQQIRTLENELERLRSGDVLNKCEINASEVEWRPADVVGEGSFSTVYKGAYCGTDVAVKELKFKLSQDDKNYFRSEAALLQQLHHPRVVLMMGVCTGSARPFMLLEYLAGGTLYNLIHNTTREKLDHAAYFVVAKDIAQGMNYLHRHDPQVLHLDLKSMNVLLDSYTRAKIADFGFSILRRSRSGSPTQRGSIRGTPAWMAPELLTKGEVSAKCDVYSYAIILWEMLTASHPFKGLDLFQIMERTESGGRPTLPVSRMSRELKELITSCWAQNPSLRPSFEEILGALETAAIPTSWRGLLQKANIKSSQLSDVAAARTIISVVEESVELVRRNLQQQRASKNRDNSDKDLDERDNQTNIYETLETDAVALADLMKQQQRNSRGISSSRAVRGSEASPSRYHSPFQRSSPTRQPYPRDSPQGRGHERRKSQVRDVSPQKDGVRRSSSKSSRAAQGDVARRGFNRDDRNQNIERGAKIDRGRQKRKDSLLADATKYRSDRQSPEKYARDVDRRKNARERKESVRKPEISKGRSKAVREHDNFESQKNWEYEKNQFNRGRKEPKQIVDRRLLNKAKLNKKKRSRSLESAVQYTDFRTDVRDHDRHSDLTRERNYQKRYSQKQNASIDHRGYENNNHRHNHNRLADSRDSLGDSQNESWTSIEGSTYGDLNNPSDDFEDHYSEKGKRRYSPSPRRISPEHHYSPSHRKQSHHSPEHQHSPNYNYSPERRRSPRSPTRRRMESGSRFGPLVVTSEQLLSQKQRLRPVRPSELSDLTHMPENSLNDISLILKTAITKRRNAFDEGMSGRDSFRSEFEWSDWH